MYYYAIRSTIFQEQKKATVDGGNDEVTPYRNKIMRAAGGAKEASHFFAFLKVKCRELLT